MALLNYSTTVAANKTAMQIQEILGKHKANAVMINYQDGDAVAISFNIIVPIGNLAIKLPIKWQAVQKVLHEQHVSYKNQQKEQAIKVAWRILKDWVEAQMAIIETEMVTLDQVFLPYIMINSGKTLYDAMVESKYQITEKSTGEQQIDGEFTEVSND